MRQTLRQINYICEKTTQSIHKANVHYGAGLLWGHYDDGSNEWFTTCYYTTPTDIAETVLSVTSKVEWRGLAQQAAEELSKHDLGGEYFIEDIDEAGHDIDRILYNDHEVDNLLMRMSAENIVYEYECSTGEQPADLQQALEYFLDIYCIEDYVTVWDAWHQTL